MEKQLKTELRKLLTGRTIRDEEGWLIAIPDGNYLIYHGVPDRTGYRKIKLREERIQVAATNEEAFHVILCVVPEGDGLVLVQAYTGRSFTAGISCKMAITNFMKKINQIQEM